MNIIHPLDGSLSEVQLPYPTENKIPPHPFSSVLCVKTTMLVCSPGLNIRHSGLITEKKQPIYSNHTLYEYDIV